MLSACVWLGNYLNTVELNNYILHILHQACKGIFLNDHPHVNVRTARPAIG